jgi:hypothetical protein
MVTLGSLVLPILVSAALVWVASALVWMVLPHHKSEWLRLPDEEAFRSALKGRPLAPGRYNVPFATGGAELKNPEMVRKYEEGPVGILTLFPSGMPKMGGMMVGSFVYYLVVGFVVAYLASRTLATGADYLTVFRVTGTTAWLAYGFAVVPESIWFGRPWRSTVLTLADALLYALLTAGVFGWMWPGT